MNKQQDDIRNFPKSRDFLICIDSDGCAFDAMEIKHKECFAPNFINHWNLQPVAKYAREVWEFVNLYSETRGCNRFQAVIHALDLLAKRPEVIARGYQKPDLTALRTWVAEEKFLGNPALEQAVKRTGDPILTQALNWSYGVNRYVAEIVRGVPPFPSVRAALQKAFAVADLMVVSATPGEALIREWHEHDLARFMKVIAGQEAGTKADHISIAKDGRYDAKKVLKIGDALGDLQAAKANDVCFFPIYPGQEEESWQAFIDEGLERFLEGNFTGEYENERIATFCKLLPSSPPWQATNS